MKATVDANILFSALLREGATRRIWFLPELELYAPEYLIVEFLKYKKYLREKFKGTDGEFGLFSQKLVSQIKLVKDSELEPFLPAATSLIKDPKDWLYLACALKADTIIWSNDKGFKEQKRIRAKNTDELLKELGGL